MIFSKNTTNISLLESELTQLKAFYKKALSKSDIPTVKELRKKIKVLSARLTTISLQHAS